MSCYSLFRSAGTALLLLMSPLGGAVDLFNAEPEVDYSGVREVVSSEGSVSMKEYYSQGNRRIEMNMGGQSAVVIHRSGQDKAWMLMSELNMYMEMPSANLDYQTAQPDVVEQEKVGSDVIEGHKADKYKSVFQDADGNRGDGFFWVTSDGIVIKVDMMVNDGAQQQHFVMLLKDLKVGKQPASLFELPAGYTAAPMMPGLVPPSQ